jgi:hypothetical protein
MVTLTGMTSQLFTLTGARHCARLWEGQDKLIPHQQWRKLKWVLH